MAAFEKAHPNLPMMMKPFLPTMDFVKYAALKSAATRAPSAVRSGPAAPEVPPSGSVTHGVAKCTGLGQNQAVSQGFFPPDTHGAGDANHFGQVVNSAIQFYH